MKLLIFALIMMFAGCTPASADEMSDAFDPTVECICRNVRLHPEWSLLSMEGRIGRFVDACTPQMQKMYRYCVRQRFGGTQAQQQDFCVRTGGAFLALMERKAWAQAGVTDLNQ